MKKLVLITPHASIKILNRYRDYDMVGLDEGILIAKDQDIPLTYAISSFTTIDLNNLLTYLSKDKILKYNSEDEPISLIGKVVNFILNNGYEEIIILDSISGRLDYIHSLVLLTKNKQGHIIIQDDSNLISYYQEGSYIITKQGYSNLSLIGFPSCVISMEHVNKPIDNLELEISTSEIISVKIQERLSTLKVLKGGVLVVLTNND